MPKDSNVELDYIQALQISRLHISGGEAQRICLIRALLLNPRILILDESLSGLDYELCDEVLAFLREWQGESRASVVLITHDEKIALRFCEKVYLLEQGKLIEYTPFTL